jgi:hypothetical protein
MNMRHEFLIEENKHKNQKIKKYIVSKYVKIKIIL